MFNLNFSVLLDGLYIDIKIVVFEPWTGSGFCNDMDVILNAIADNAVLAT